MTNAEITGFLRGYNKWRRDDGEEAEGVVMPHPSAIGEAIDEAIERINAQEAALRPFARLARDFAYMPDSAELTVKYTPGFTGLCVADIRKAKELTQ